MTSTTRPIANGLTSLALGSPLGDVETWRPRRIAIAGVRFATGATLVGEPTAEEKAAADKAAADKAAADKKAADDKAAADAAGKGKGDEGKTAEQLAAEKKAADDKAAADKKAADDKAAADAAAKNGKGKADGAGQSKAPDKYELTVPDDAKRLITPAVLKRHEALARENDWTNEEAQADLEARIEQAQLEVVEQRAEWLTATKADPDYGGKHLEASTTLARKGVSAIRPADHPRREAFVRLLNESGLGDHVEVVAFLADLGKLVGEDTPHLGRIGAPREEAKSDGAVLFPSSEGAAKS